MAISFLFFLLAHSLLLISGEELNVFNHCGRDIFVKSENANSGPFSLSHGQSRTMGVDRGRRTRVWAHLGCDGGGGGCDTSEGYVSLAEMHWEGNGWNWYDVSQVDGYNLPVRMEPYNPNAPGNCRVASCNFNIDNDCPGGDKQWKDGRAVACKNPNRDGVTEYSQAIKRACPGVYSWSQDDAAGMRDCQPGNPGLNIHFC